MAGQYIPLPEHAPPPLPREMPSEERFRTWLELLHFGEQCLLAGLKHRVGEGGDLEAAYRAWYELRSAERLQQLLRRAKELERRTVESC